MNPLPVDPRSDVTIGDVLAAALDDDAPVNQFRWMLVWGRKPTLLVCEKPKKEK